MIFRDWRPEDAAVVWKLNRSEVPHVGELGERELEELCRKARTRIAEANGTVAGFVVLMNETTDYSSLNFVWFKERYPKFAYVDRIVVNPEFRGQGLGRKLYDDVRALTDAPVLTCEVNLKPPNPDSIAFHEWIGFEQVGIRESGDKAVAMMVMSLQ